MLVISSTIAITLNILLGLKKDDFSRAFCKRITFGNCIICKGNTHEGIKFQQEEHIMPNTYNVFR